jgi:hypothetical protein
MSSPEPIDSHRKSSGLALAAWIALGLLICYPLSIGPVARYFSNGSPPAAVEAIYAPLGYLYSHSDAAKAAFDWYAKLWGVDL